MYMYINNLFLYITCQRKLPPFHKVWKAQAPY